MCTATSLLVLVKHTKRAANISELVLIQFELEVWRVCRDKSQGTAEAADTRSIAVELLSQTILAGVDSHTLLLCGALVQQLYVQGIACPLVLTLIKF